MNSIDYLVTDLKVSVPEVGVLKPEKMGISICYEPDLSTAYPQPKVPTMST